MNALVVSSLNGNGFDELIIKMNAFYSKIKDSGYLDNKRKDQHISWLNDAIKMEILKKYSSLENEQKNDLLNQVSEGKIHPAKAARILVKNI